MLLFFLSSLLFLSNSLSLDKLSARETVADDVKMGADDVMMHIQMVMRNQTGNSKSLIESLEKLDPATIASVVVLVEQLLASVASDLLALQQASELSISAYNDANGAHDAAVVEKVRLDEVILAHQASLAQQVIVVQSTLDTKNTASGAKINSQETLDAASPRLNGEHSTLTQVLGLINSLAPVLAPGCIESTEIGENWQVVDNQHYPIISGAKWELTHHWDCGSNDIPPYGGAQPSWGNDGSIEARRNCAKKCLGLANCIAFNYPLKDFNGKCWMKSKGQNNCESPSNCNTMRNSCGKAGVNYQYYTLFSKNPPCSTQ